MKQSTSKDRIANMVFGTAVYFSLAWAMHVGIVVALALFFAACMPWWNLSAWIFPKAVGEWYEKMNAVTEEGE